MPTSGNIETAGYPLQVGNSWTYLRTIDFLYPGTNTAADFFAPPLEDYVYVTVDRTESITNYPLSYVVKSRLEFSEDFSENYYDVKEDGLYHVAYSNAGAAPIVHPKQAQKGAINFNNKSYASMNELLAELTPTDNPGLPHLVADSLRYENPPLLTLKYPLQVGSEWIYRQNFPWRMRKAVEGEKMIETVAGNFFCFEIKWLYDMDNNNSWDENIYIIDHIANEGLIKRTLYILGAVYTDEYGNETSGFDYKETIALTDYSAQNAG